MENITIIKNPCVLLVILSPAYRLLKFMDRLATGKDEPVSHCPSRRDASVPNFVRDEVISDPQLKPSAHCKSLLICSHVLQSWYQPWPWPFSIISLLPLRGIRQLPFWFYASPSPYTDEWKMEALKASQTTCLFFRNRLNHDHRNASIESQSEPLALEQST